jgi:hypothetical protein
MFLSIINIFNIFAPIIIYLKKLLAYIVLILFIYNLAGYYIVFRGWQTGIRCQIKKQIRSDSKNAGYDVLKFSKSDLLQKKIILEWEKDDEFCFNENMYDVKSKIETTDSITFICFNDRKEKKLIDQLQTWVNQQHENTPSDRSNPFKIIDNLVKDYCHEHQFVLNIEDGISINKFAPDVLPYDTFIEVLSPPPRQII